MFYYATELRCYALLLGAIGVAMVAWQRAAEAKKPRLSVAVLFLSLVFAICCHYYAVFVWVPFGLAELARTWSRKRIDWPVWLAFILSPAVLLIFIPEMRAARSIYVGGYWAKAHWSQIASVYQSLVSISILPILVVVLACLLLAPRFARPLAGGAPSLPLHEWVFAGSLSLLPAFAVPPSILTGAFHERYVLACVGGVAIVLAFALCRSMRGDHFVGAIITLVFGLWFVVKNGPEVRRQMVENGGLTTPLGQPLRAAAWNRELERSKLPIAVAGSLFFMQYQHYAAPEVHSRVYYLADEELALRYEGVSTPETNFLQFRRAIPLQAVRFHEFISGTPHFLACVENVHSSWLLPALLEIGAQMRLLDTSANHFVFDVIVPPNGRRPASTNVGQLDEGIPTKVARNAME
jgi:hypothetical protein